MNTKYFYTTFYTDSHCINSNNLRDDLAGHEVKKSELDEHGHMQKVDEKDETLIACLNLIESKVYLYRENGLLVNRCDFMKDIKEYGDIISASNDGLSFIFKKKNKSEFSILELSFTGFKFVKKIDIIAYLTKYVMTNGLEKEYDNLFDSENWI